MPVKLTRYSRNLNKPIKKRTILQNRKKAIANRHKSPRNTAICPEGQRYINGTCTEASGVNFHGSHDTRVSIKDIPKPSGKEILNISNLDAVTLQKELTNHLPHWLSKSSVSIDTIKIVIDYVETLSIEERKIKSIYDKVLRARRLEQKASIIVLNNIVASYPLVVQEWINDMNDNNQVFGFGWLVAILLAVALYFAFK